MKRYTYLKPRTLLHEFSFFSILFALSAIFSVSSYASNDANQGQPVSVTGELTVLHVDDLKNHQSKYIYTLKDKDSNQNFELSFEGQPPENLRSGSKIRVHGNAFGNQIVVGANTDGTNNIETIAFAGALTSGQQNTIVLIADFKDVAVSCPVQEIEDLMFTDPNLKSLDDFYQKNSQGNVSFAGNVAGPYLINYNSTGSCDFNAWANATDAQATANGIDLSVYNRKVYVMPQNSCGASGLGTLGGNPSRSWVFYCNIPDVYGHEIGHNLSMHHASDLISEYGDHSDVMGITNGWVHSNAPHKEQMGWLPAGQIQNANQNGIYFISPLEEDSAVALESQVLKIAKPDTNEYYYLSYRHAIDNFSNLSNFYKDKIQIHRYKGDGSSSFTYFHDALTDGEAFTDTINGITVTQLSHTPDYATVDIQFDSNCSSNAPTLTLSPSSQIGSPGMTLIYNIAVSNTDSVNCSQTTFELADVLPSGWSGEIYPSNLTLSPGSTGTATLSVISSSTALDGDYFATVQVYDNWDTRHARSGNVIYTILTDTEAPTAPSGVSATEKRQIVNLSWTRSTDNVSVTGYYIWRDGNLIAEIPDTSFSDINVTSGTSYNYFVTAYDDMNNESAPSSTVTVSIGSGSKGGGQGGRGNKK